MRKLLSTLMATAICTLVIVGCSKNSDPYNPPTPTPTPPTPTPTPEETYDQAFKAYVGGTIASNQDWGFGASVIAARAATRGSETGYYVADDYIKLYTKDFFKEALDSLPEGKKVGESYKNFEFKSNGPFRFDFVFSNTKEDMEIGYYYYNPDNETADQAKMVPLIAKWKTELAAKQLIQWTYKTTPSANSWWEYSSEDGYSIWENTPPTDAKTVRTKMFTLRDGSSDPSEKNPDKTIDVPKDYRVGFYVKTTSGKVAYTNRNLNSDDDFYFAVLDSKTSTSSLVNTYLVGIEDGTSTDDKACDFDCNDVMIAVHKNLEETFPDLVILENKPKTWRVIAEDLSASENTDFDFNDIVLDVTLTKTGADCVLQAAGAELPIRVNGDDNNEVHKLFGVGEKDMVNTNAPKGVKKEPVKFSITGSFKSVKDVKIEVKKDDGKWHELYAKTGDSACKILVTTDFVWPDEQQSIKVKYPKFVDWVKDPTVVWYP